MEFEKIQITLIEAHKIASEYLSVVDEISFLPGEIDFNFKVKSGENNFILKVSRPDFDLKYLDFQNELLQHLESKNVPFLFPKIIKNQAGDGQMDYLDANGQLRKVRMLEWIEGDLFSDYFPKSESLYYSLGKKGGEITNALLDFKHQLAIRTFDWDLANGLWTANHLDVFTENEREIVVYFLEKFKNIQKDYAQLRKSTIHNDANENNIVVNSKNGEIAAIIDYGDAVYSQIINDLAVSLAYAIMDTEQPLQAAIPIVKGYHEAFPLQEKELEVLYILVAMRLVISVTKSAINKQKEPENKYLLVSERPAWDLLKKWKDIPENFAFYCFRSACGFEPCPQNLAFQEYTKNNLWTVKELLPEAEFWEVETLDISISSKYVGNYANYIGSDKLYEKIVENYTQNGSLLVGGYGEVRPVYTTDAFKTRVNEGFEHRTVHLGVDFWQKAGTSILAIEDGEVFGCFDNAHPKDYGPTLILKHKKEGLVFYTLYGHLSRESLKEKYIGKKIKKGEKIAEIGEEIVNGGWAPHLHFQVILDMLGHETDFIGVSTPSLWPVYSSICPDPNAFFKISELKQKESKTFAENLNFRKQHLGKSLSLSYEKPLNIVRGQGQFLIDDAGQKYLDTVNNVAHVGHEHPKVVEAGASQMALLNTNTRYLNDEILVFAEELLQTFPPELSVLHFVNSGSEANELAMRMAKAFSGQKDMLALEVGYHGNTQACIDVSSYKFNGKGGAGCPEHTHIVPLPDAFRGIYRGKGAGSKYAKHVKDAIENIQSNGRNVAGFIAESIVSCGGQIDLPDGFLKEAYGYIRAAGGVCIADEVQVGFGRVGKAFWGFQLHGVMPDIVTMGKPIGNGHPLAAVVCTREVAEAFANGMEYFNTFGGNPVSCAIGRQVLATIKEEKMQENALEVGEYLKNSLNELQKEFPIFADIRGEGLFLGIELCDENLQPLPDQTNYLANRMKDFKILMSVDGPDHNVLKIKPPMCFSIADADYLLDCLGKVLLEYPLAKASGN
ncbi:aminotransferase class III-fold pyridoxal phosphate-dependent enzyme [Lacihabitans sp. LS3-19]|uniref:aminotransferase class III-fold pyridoxal phosphate-dependent enzyme n=1 Tax=Lacihabitans sp. LS3-19 TaxID=2487335 RepID=UPI0020CEE18C|nr:aminotransferase class III-fold pyridoxal phosphate-dependent enzyme [Lacihabitans sp. LS3-19]MCP9768576.1 aminotransferase class III-fold pyridoxal phosphate-dependent enzyme [Lacihabitans sp. LS3-19]